MIYSEMQLHKFAEKDYAHMGMEDKIAYNILNFIHTIHLNEQDFVGTRIKSEYYGELPMRFRKNPGQVAGMVTTEIDGSIQTYVFHDLGFEKLDDLLNL